jgi:acyl-CoA dehydrogenase
MLQTNTDGSSPVDFDHCYRSGAYKEEHRAWRKTLRDFIEAEIIPYVEEWEEAGEFPRELYKKAGAIGLLGMGYPEEYGGTPVDDHMYSMVTSEEMARIGAGGVGASLLIHGIGLPPIIRYGSEEMKQRIAPAVLSGDKVICLAITEPSGGSDVANLQTRAELRGGHYVVNGAKMFITGGMRGDYFTTAVRTGGEGKKGISLLLIDGDSEGLTRTPLKKQGWLCSDTAALSFVDVKVPKENLIGAENDGFRGIVANFNGERIGMGTNCVAHARVCFEDALAWARLRETFGRRLADHQVIRHKFAEMARHIAATQAYLDQCVERVHNGETPIADLSLLKVQATRTLEFCAREASQIIGGASYMRGERVERIYREVRVNAIGGGSEEIMLDLAARQLGI